MTVLKYQISFKKSSEIEILLVLYLLPIPLFFQYENVNCDSRADENFRKSDAIVNSKMNFKKYYFTQIYVVKGSCRGSGYGWHLRFHMKRRLRLYFSHSWYFRLVNFRIFRFWFFKIFAAVLFSCQFSSQFVLLFFPDRTDRK